ncbi:MAG: hypothetical protein WCG09_05050 [Halobacteriota archaeon]|jgi:hypothetical protein
MIWGLTDEVGNYWLARFDVLKKRWPRVENEVVSKIQTSKWLFDSEKPDEATKLASDAKRVFTDFYNEVEEVATQIERHKGVNLRGVDDVMATLERMRKDIDLFENALREEIMKAR